MIDNNYPILLTMAGTFFFITVKLYCREKEEKTFDEDRGNIRRMQYRLILHNRLH